jgi:hypothetical protein
MRPQTRDLAVLTGLLCLSGIRPAPEQTQQVRLHGRTPIGAKDDRVRLRFGPLPNLDRERKNRFAKIRPALLP